MPSKPSLILHSRSLTFASLLDNVQEWGEVEHRVATLPLAERGDAFETVMAALLLVDPAQQIQNAWFPASQAPQGILSSLGMVSRQDKGLDGVAIDRNGRQMAIQFKFRSTDRHLNWADISTFFGQSDTAGVRLLASNVATVDETAAVRPNAQFLLRHDLEKIPAEHFIAAAALMRQKPVHALRLQERQDQQDAVQKTLSTFDPASPDESPRDRATVVSACGTGKTLIGERMMEKMVGHGARDILVFVPSIALIDQTVRQWASQWAGHHDLKDRVRYLMVCSDEKAGDDEDDRLAMHARDLAIKATTDPQSIENFLVARHLGDDEVRVIFSTYQSSFMIEQVVQKRRQDIPDWAFDFGLCDEAHRTAIRITNAKSTDVSPFIRPLLDQYIPIRKRLFMTATPRLRRLHHSHQDVEGNIASYSMDNEALYGPKVHDYSFAQAAAEGVISRYKVVITTVDQSDVEAMTQVWVNGPHGSQKILSFEDAASKLALAKTLQTTGAQRVLTFHARVKDAERFTEGMGSIQDVLNHLGETGWDALHVSGKQGLYERDQRLRSLRQRGKTLRASARILTEGVDVPAVDMVAFMGKRSSSIAIVQAVGRALRKYDGKDVGYVVLPLIRQDGRSLDEAMDSARDLDNGFDTIVTVIAALMDHDQDLANVINDFRAIRVSGTQEEIAAQRKRLRGHLQFVDASYHSPVHGDDPLHVGLNALHDRIEQRLVDHLGDSFMVNLGYFKAYQQRNPERRIQAKDRVSKEGELVPRESRQGKRIGGWINRCRQDYKEGTLSKDRIERMEALRMVWSVDFFETSLETLTAYMEKNPGRKIGINDRVSIDGEVLPEDSDGGEGLGRWLSKCRIDYRNGRLSDEKVVSLKALGVEMDLAFDINLSCLMAYSAKNPGRRLGLNERVSFDGDVLSKESNDGRKIGQWLGQVRQDYKNGTLSKERIEKFNKMDIVWDEREEAVDSYIECFKNYFKKYPERKLRKKERVSRDGEILDNQDEGYGLGVWIINLRQKYKNGKLPEELIERLNAMGMVWHKHEASFEDNIYYFKMYHDKNPGRVIGQKDRVSSNGALVEKGSMEGKSLGAWLSDRLQEYRKGKLSRERIAMLDAVDIKWRRCDSIKAKYDDISENLSEKDTLHETMTAKRGQRKLIVG